MNGELEYTQILNDLKNGKTETADIKIIYNINTLRGFVVVDGTHFYNINPYNKKAVYKILDEEANRYKIDIFITDSLSQKEREGTYKYYLFDSHFRMPQ
jgi:hypothetical protein